MTENNALIVYDGDCIFCQNYVRLLRLRQTVGPVDLVDARSADPRVKALQAAGYDLDQGMIFVHQGRTHFGSDAIHMLAILSSSSTTLGRINRRLLSSRGLAAALYPALKLGRRVTLALRGKSLISNSPDFP